MMRGTTERRRSWLLRSALLACAALGMTGIGAGGAHAQEGGDPPAGTDPSITLAWGPDETVTFPAGRCRTGSITATQPASVLLRRTGPLDASLTVSMSLRVHEQGSDVTAVEQTEATFAAGSDTATYPLLITGSDMVRRHDVTVWLGTDANGPGAGGQQLQAVLVGRSSAPETTGTCDEGDWGATLSYTVGETISGPIKLADFATWTIVSGTVPPGMTFDARSLSGTPTTAGQYRFVAQECPNDDLGTPICTRGTFDVTIRRAGTTLDEGLPRTGPGERQWLMAAVGAGAVALGGALRSLGSARRRVR